MASIVLEEYELLEDAKYRAYMSQVDKALRSFEYTNEWADLIAALGKLNKVLLAHMKYPIIPRRIVISKRLAQCMHPALPSGVHLKALDTYDIIFKCMGTNRLAQELFLYSAGLFPLLGHAAINVRPVLLAVYEQHFVPLGERLRPALNGLLAGILLGLEEGSDHYERTNQLLELICEASQPQVFYRSLWECVASNPSIRLAAVCFVLRHFDRRIATANQSHLFGTDLPVVVRALCAAVQDSSVLVQRNALDLLIQMFPMHDSIKSPIVSADRVEILAAATAVLLRRDMSLNRRLYSWLLGSDTSSDRQKPSMAPSDQTIYFNHFAKETLIEALRIILQRSLDGDEFPNLKPYRLLMTLLDKSEIGLAVIEHISMDVFRALYHSHRRLVSASPTDDSTRSSKSHSDASAAGLHELIKTANLLFGCLEASYLWSFCGAKLQTASCQSFRVNDTHNDPVNCIGSPETTVVEMCAIVDFLLDIASVGTYVETQSQYIPTLFKKVVSVVSSQCSQLTSDELTRALRLARKVLSKVQPVLNAWDAACHRTQTDQAPMPALLADAACSPKMEIGQEATESKTASSPTSLEESEPSELQKLQKMHEALMTDCAQTFQHLMAVFFKTKVFSEPFTPHDYIQKLLRRSGNSVEARVRRLERLLIGDHLAGDDLGAAPTDEEAMVDCFRQEQLPLRDQVGRLSQAFQCLCSIVIDLSSMPVMMSSKKRQASVPQQQQQRPQEEVAVWLQYILIASSFLGPEHAFFALTSCQTMLKMLDLLSSRLKVESTQTSNVVILTKPMISECDFDLILKGTVWPLLMAAKLWDGLGTMSPVYHLTCVSLLQHLHHLVLDPMGVERIVARTLGQGSSQTVDAYHRFTLLWHLSRDVSSVECSGTPRNFDICLLKMLDNLNSSTTVSGPLQTLSQNWLMHAMARGDLARIMEPLFLTLLDPSTARVSVLHCQIAPLPATSLADKVFSITPSCGDTFHHVGDKRWTVLPSGPNKRLFALAAFQGSGRASPDRHALFVPSGNADGLKDLLQVNPFALVPPDVDDYEAFTHGYRGRQASVKSQGQFSDSSSASSSDSSSSCSSSQDDGSEEGLTTSSAERIVRPIVEMLVSLATRHHQCRPSSCSNESSSMSVEHQTLIHPLHSHVLLYTQVSDSRQILYVMKCIRNILQTNPRTAICTLIKTSFTWSSGTSPRSSQVHKLLARHRKSVFGKGFMGPITSEMYRNSLLIEMLVSTLLYYLRSYYPNLGQVHLSHDDIRGNREVQLMSIDILVILVSELAMVVRDNGRQLANYIADLFARCKVQKVVLHSLLAGVHHLFKDTASDGAQTATAGTFTEDLLLFNEVSSSASAAQPAATAEKVSNYSEAFQVQLLRLLLSLVMLEQVVQQQQRADHPHRPNPDDGIADRDKSAASGPLEVPPLPPPLPTVQGHSALRYCSDLVIPDQPMFLEAILNALSHDNIRHLHSHWTSLVTSCLPFLGRSLANTVNQVTTQLCTNLERLVAFYSAHEHDRVATLGHVPADYVVTQLEALTVICHYVLLDSASQLSAAFSHHISQSASCAAATNNGSLYYELGSNLLHAFTWNADVKTWNGGVNLSQSSRISLLAKLPRLISCAAILWSAISQAEQAGGSSTTAACMLVGAPKVVRSRMLDLLSPVAQNHSVAFMSAVSITWHERRKQQQGRSGSFFPPTFNDQQMVLVDLVSAIRSMPVASVIQTVRNMLKSPPTVSGNEGMNVEVSVLQFFYAYLAKCSAAQVFDSWSVLSGLLRDCLDMAPACIFLALAVLSQFVHRSPAMTDRKDHKELQELAGRLIDSCSHIAGSCLEQTTWLRRNLAVKSDLQVSDGEAETASSAATAPQLLVLDSSCQQLNDLLDTSRSPPHHRSLYHYSVPALALLAKLMVPILDIIYLSDEKEKVIPLLYNVMQNVIPYLRNHTKANLASFRASSQLMASLSEYQYTRKAWRKEAFELLLDTAFFQMDRISIKHWKVTVDNLMTHDKTTLKELLAKVAYSISPSGSLSLFSSKEQELEQRALLLKRLAFAIYCSVTDQYQKQMPEIQERLAESLRTIPFSPAVQSAVFLCFRVILVRMSPHYITSLWPLIITEMVQIFSFMEQELSTDTEEWSCHLKYMSTLDSSWVVSSGSNGLASHCGPAWLQLYLSVCKLLDLSLALPAQMLPQFQMYRWAFVSEGFESKPQEPRQHEKSNGCVMGHHPDFVPYVVRVANLLLRKADIKKVKPMQLQEGQPQLLMATIQSLGELAPFFAAICRSVTRQQAITSQPVQPHTTDVINALLEMDFLEPVSK